MIDETGQALRDFTQRYCDFWQQEVGHAPARARKFLPPAHYSAATAAEVPSTFPVVPTGVRLLEQ